MPPANHVERRPSKSRLKEKIGSIWRPGRWWEWSGKKIPLNSFVTRSQVMGSDQRMGKGGALREKHFSCDTIIDKSHEIAELQVNWAYCWDYSYIVLLRITIISGFHYLVVLDKILSPGRLLLLKDTFGKMRPIRNESKLFNSEESLRSSSLLF